MASLRLVSPGAATDGGAYFFWKTFFTHRPLQSDNFLAVVSSLISFGCHPLDGVTRGGPPPLNPRKRSWRRKWIMTGNEMVSIRRGKMPHAVARSRTCNRRGEQRRVSPKHFSEERLPRKKILILNLKLSNSSHSERHFCSLATYCISIKHCFWPPKAAPLLAPLDPPLTTCHPRNKAECIIDQKIQQK